MLSLPFWTKKNNYCLLWGRLHFTKSYFYSPLLDLQITEIIRKGSKNDLFLHYIFMDNAFELPTGLGLQLQVASSGVLTPGVKAGVKLEVAQVSPCSPCPSLGGSFPPGSGSRAI